MLKIQQFEPLRCGILVAVLLGAASSAIAQSNNNSPKMLGFTARQMLTAQPVSEPDYIVRSPYVGMGVGRSMLDPDTSKVPGLSVTEGEQVGGQLTVGMDFGEWLSGEFHATELGEADLSDGTSVSYQEYGLSALMYLGDNRDRFNRRGWNVFGRAGLGYLTNDISEATGYRQEEGGQWIVGAGAEFSTRSGFGIRAEGLMFDADFSYVQLGLLYRFAKLPGGMTGISDLGVSSVEDTVPGEAEKREATESIGAVQAEIAQTEADREEAVRVEELARAEEADRAEKLALAEEAARVEEAARLAELARTAEAARLENDRIRQAELTAQTGARRMVLDGVIDGLKFQPDSSELTNAARRILDDVVVALNDVPQRRARLNTHTDASGTAEGNLRLSQQRVLSIARYLVQQGISKSRLEARAFGDRRPIDTNDTAAGRFNNGRVEIFLLP